MALDLQRALQSYGIYAIAQMCPTTGTQLSHEPGLLWMQLWHGMVAHFVLDL